MKRTAHLEIRSQPAKGTWPRQGPDTYVAVQIVPEDQVPLRVLNRSVAKKRGIEIVYCGEGYRANQSTDKSLLGFAILKARELVSQIND
jgi:hypothetical protein